MVHDEWATMQFHSGLKEKMIAFIDEAQTKEILRVDELRGCSEQEIADLEARYHVELPDAYKLYLNIMGNASGQLYGYHFVGTYSDVLNLTADVREAIASFKQEVIAEREMAADEIPPEPFPAFGELPIDTFDLPRNALVIARGRVDGIYYFFIECNGGEDAVVRYVNMDDLETFGTITYPSLFDYWRWQIEDGQ